MDYYCASTFCVDQIMIKWLKTGYTEVIHFTKDIEHHYLYQKHFVYEGNTMTMYRSIKIPDLSHWIAIDQHSFSSFFVNFAKKFMNLNWKLGMVIIDKASQQMTSDAFRTTAQW